MKTNTIHDTIIINGWECFIDKETHLRSATKYNKNNQIMSDIAYDPEDGLIWSFIDDQIPRVVLLWLLQAELYNAWEDGCYHEAQDNVRGYDKNNFETDCSSENPYKR